ALDALHLDAGTEITVAGELFRQRFQIHALARIPRRVGIGDVVAGGGERRLAGGKTGDADADQGCHSTHLSNVSVESSAMISPATGLPACCSDSLARTLSTF